MLSDIEIAKNARMQNINEIADKLEIDSDYIENYGKYKAKINIKLLDKLKDKKDGKLILVTAVNPTAAGEGKTTITVGLSQAINSIGKKVVTALREPSLGPVFGMKGGAAGGGYSQVVPMEDINLHFTGDMHAITSANNLLCAMIDNHIHQGNSLGIDVNRILFKRCLDMNDRALRQTVVGLGTKFNGVPREDGFQITVASEIMAIFCLATSVDDLKEKLGNILVAYSYDSEPVFARDIKADGAMTALLKDAIYPNLVQSLENTPTIIHGGPFANIAHGCNSVLATKMALKLGDYVVTEAGFGSDLGAEKFLNIKCPTADITPSCVVVVATIRALKHNGGVVKDELKNENLTALKQGLENLKAHVNNMKKFNLPVVVAVNKFFTDTQAEIDMLFDYCKQLDVPVECAEVFEHGSKGGVDLAKRVCDIVDAQETSEFKPLYDDTMSVKEKIDVIAKEIYHAGDVSYTPKALKNIAEIEKLNMDKFPICVAKTQYSLSDNPKLLGFPTGHTLTVKELRVSAGAKFIVVYTGDIMTMPGLPKVPSAEFIDVEDGEIVGLF